MEKLPIEICEEIFGRIIWTEPAKLYRLRAVSKKWRKIIDECWSRIFKLSQNKCSEIPEHTFNDITQKLFPLSSKPWQKSYWKDCMLPHVPRAVYQAWQNLPNLMKDNLKITKSSMSIRNSIKYPSFDMNDKYLAVCFGSSEARNFGSINYLHYDSEYEEQYDGPIEPNNCTTCIYKLDNLKKPVRCYPLNCKNVDFYTVGTRMFIILQAKVNLENQKHHQWVHTKWTVKISEFEKNDQLNSLPFSSYAIVDNEFFSFSGRKLRRYIFTGETFTESTGITLSEKDAGYKGRIKRVRIEGSELQLFVAGGFHEMRILRYQITRASDNTLNFTPNATNYIEIVTVNCPPCSLSNRRPMDIRFYVRRREFKSWFQDQYHHSITSLIVHGDYIIAGTKNGEILIFHQGVEKIMECILRSGKTSLDYLVIDLNIRGLRGSITPLGLTYNDDSTPRLFLNINNSLIAIDFL